MGVFIAWTRFPDGCLFAHIYYGVSYMCIYKTIPFTNALFASTRR